MKKKTQELIGIFSLAIVIVLGLSIWTMAGQNNQDDHNQISEEDQTECKDELDVSYWNTYQNEKYGYRINYPATWLVDDYSKSNKDDAFSSVVFGITKLESSPEKEVVREIGIMTNFGWVKDHILSFPIQKFSLKEYIYDIDSSLEITIGKNIKALKQEIAGIEIEYVMWFTNKDGNLYRISYPKETDFLCIIEQMLTSFEF